MVCASGLDDRQSDLGSDVIIEGVGVADGYAVENVISVVKMVHRYVIDAVGDSCYETASVGVAGECAGDDRAVRDGDRPTRVETVGRVDVGCRESGIGCNGITAFTVVSIIDRVAIKIKRRHAVQVVDGSDERVLVHVAPNFPMCVLARNRFLYERCRLYVAALHKISPLPA